jgi:hypothetical protein
MDFQSPEEAAAAFDAAVATQMQVASGLPTTTERRAASPDSFPAEVAGIPVHTPYDSGTGLFVGPDSQPYLVGAGTNGQPAGSDWRSLVLGPLGVPVPDQTGGDR